MATCFFYTLKLVLEVTQCHLYHPFWESISGNVGNDRQLLYLKGHTTNVMHIKPQEILNLIEHSWTFTKSKDSLWQTINHEILAKPHQNDIYPCLLLLLWIHTKSDDTTHIVFPQASSYSVHTVCFCET